MSSRPRYAVFISGRGSNLKSILQYEGLHEPSLVLSSRRLAEGLKHAEGQEIPTAVVRSRDFETVSAFNSALDAALERERIEWIVLAGYMVILPAPFVARHAPQIVNIHPSLLPLFPGLHPHRQALEAGATESGCTVHHVEPGAVDSGRVIAQATVPILSTDTEEALAQRILQAEHRLYPATLAQLLR